MMRNFPDIALWKKGKQDFLMNQVGPSIDSLLKKIGNGRTSVCRINGRSARVTKLESEDYIALAISHDKDRINSRKIMDSEVLSVLAAAPTIEASKIKSEHRSRAFIHNLKSLTAKTTQEIFYLVPQDGMLLEPRECINFIERCIIENPRDAAQAILKILKHQNAQIAEYSAFDKISGKIGSIKKETHDLHRVLMNVFYLFFNSFTENKVRVDVEKTTIQATFDYDSIHACIYYIVDNASKYIMKNSSFNISTRLTKSGFVEIYFEMESLIINKDEEEMIFEEGYSGTYAVSMKKNGDGIGLYLAREMAKLNGGSLNINAGRATNAGNYARNSFVLTLRSE